MSFEDSTDDEIRESGIGILEFSPAKAGQDVTQANYNFPPKERKRSSSGFTSLPGNGLNLQCDVYICTVFAIVYFKDFVEKLIKFIHFVLVDVTGGRIGIDIND